MTPEKWYRDLRLASIPLVKLDDSDQVIDASSACLLAVNGAHVLVTAAHGAASGGRWAIQVAAVPPGSARLYSFGALTTVSTGHLGLDGLRDTDLAITGIPLHVSPVEQILDEVDLSVREEQARTVVPFTRMTLPDRSSRYGFAGLTNLVSESQRVRGQAMTIIGSETRVVVNLTYMGDRNGDAFFKLPYPHPGHEYFKGCSGAPIMDEGGKIVAIVSGGCKRGDEIVGIPLLPFRTALLIESGLV